ncbi:MAG: hypothetical protein IJ562_07255 [Prevotella sp.]|nr:hypothetical protein [Prevotella sp.]
MENVKARYVSPECLVVRIDPSWLMDLDIPVNLSKTTDEVGAKNKSIMMDDDWQPGTTQKSLWDDDDDED